MEAATQQTHPAQSHSINNKTMYSLHMHDYEESGKTVKMIYTKFLRSKVSSMAQIPFED